MAHSEGICFHLQPARSKHTLKDQVLTCRLQDVQQSVWHVWFWRFLSLSFHFLSWSCYYDCLVLLSFSMVCWCSYEVRQGLLQSRCTEQRKGKCWDYQQLKWFLDSKTQLLMSRSVVRQFSLTPVRKGVLMFVVVFLVGRCHFFNSQHQFFWWQYHNFHLGKITACDPSGMMYPRLQKWANQSFPCPWLQEWAMRAFPRNDWGRDTILPLEMKYMLAGSLELPEDTAWE